jgi:N-glycosylase/DNA lyase
MSSALFGKTFPATDYDLPATLDSGQAFGWHLTSNGWEGVLGDTWVRLNQTGEGILAQTAVPVTDWSWLTDYLQLEMDLGSITNSFPNDEPMQMALQACRGLRLLRQHSWECLASFILSSTKQIVQIKQIVGHLRTRFGQKVEAPHGSPVTHRFPTPEILAEATVEELRNCKMGFRAPYLRDTARAVVERRIDLAALANLRVEQARDALMYLPGVGRKVADCVLLFAYGFQSAFPVDVWVMNGLRELYFPRRKVSVSRLHEFAASHFGPNAGYAQQYLFHYLRTKNPLYGGRTPRRAPARN